MNSGLFVDVNNLFYCVRRKFQGRLDYEKYLQAANAIKPINRSIAYGLQNEDEATSFITFLKKIGYDAKYKKRKCLTPDAPLGERKYRDIDWNVGIAVDIFRMLDRLDCVMIGSSDPDLVPVLEVCRDKGVQTIIFSAIISKELREAADRYFEIQEDLIDRRDNGNSLVVPA